MRVLILLAFCWALAGQAVASDYPVPEHERDLTLPEGMVQLDTSLGRFATDAWIRTYRYTALSVAGKYGIRDNLQVGASWAGAGYHNDGYNQTLNVYKLFMLGTQYGLVDTDRFELDAGLTLPINFESDSPIAGFWIDLPTRLLLLNGLVDIRAGQDAVFYSFAEPLYVNVDVAVTYQITEAVYAGLDVDVLSIYGGELHADFDVEHSLDIILGHNSENLDFQVSFPPVGTFYKDLYIEIGYRPRMR